MNLDEFARKAERTRERAAELAARVRRASTSGAEWLLVEAVEELAASVEELRGAEAELRARQDDMIAAREAALRGVEAKMLALFHSDVIGIAWGEESTVTDANDAFLRILGYTRDELRAGVLDWEAMTPQELHARDDIARKELLATGHWTAYEKEFFRKDGRRVSVLLGGTALALEPLRYVSFMLDISEQKQMEQALRFARAEAEEARSRAVEAQRLAEQANRAKSQFLAAMSHELRTPLNAIAGYAELLELGIRGPVTPEQRQDLQRIRRSQRRLLALITDVLNFAKIETGTVHFTWTQVPVDELLISVGELISAQVRERRLVYSAQLCGAACTVFADREKVQQVLLNLLTNAVKFTEPGGSIAVACEIRAATIAVRVRDTGSGIAPGQLEAIFEPFVQVERRLNNPGEGSGLGLAISRDLARAMGGDLTAESRLGAGSTFTLTLPRHAPPAAMTDDHTSTATLEDGV